MYAMKYHVLLSIMYSKDKRFRQTLIDELKALTERLDSRDDDVSSSPTDDDADSLPTDDHGVKPLGDVIILPNRHINHQQGRGADTLLRHLSVLFLSFFWVLIWGTLKKWITNISW